MKLKKGQWLPFKRRRKRKTDYRRRLALLKSGKLRLVIRKAHNAIHLQLVRFEPGGDRTAAEVDSRSLAKLGWPLHTGSIPAAYLTGYMFGLKMKEQGIEAAVLDIGLHRATKGGVLFAAARGAADAGLEVPLSEDIVPDESRLRGEHIATYARQLKDNPEAFKRQFGRTADAEKATEIFEMVKRRIASQFGR